MSDMVKNLTQVCIALLLTWIISYGGVFAQQLCCGTISDRCISVFNRINTDATLRIKCRASESHNRGRIQPCIISSELSPNKVNAKSSCCENEPCDRFNLTTCYNNSSPQAPVLRVKEFGSFHETNSPLNSLNQKSLPIPPHPASIYILTRSIIC